MKREYAKLVTVLQAYALISTEVRMICTNQVCPAIPMLSAREVNTYVIHDHPCLNTYV